MSTRSGPLRLKGENHDFTIRGGSVGLALYDNRLEIASIGELHFGLTPEALLSERESKPWNPMIAHTFYCRGIIESWGRGTLKITRLMQEAGLDPPTLAVRAGAVVFTFSIPKELQGAARPGTALRLAKVRPGKTPVRILVLLTTMPSLSIPELALRLGKSVSAVERAIRGLKVSGRLVRVGPAKGGQLKMVEE